jgi:hypothetical protein
MNRDLPKFIGYAAIAIFAYHLIQLILPLLVYGLIALVVLWLVQECLNHKK